MIFEIIYSIKYKDSKLWMHIVSNCAWSDNPMVCCLYLHRWEVLVVDGFPIFIC